MEVERCHMSVALCLSTLGTRTLAVVNETYKSEKLLLNQGLIQLYSNYTIRYMHAAAGTLP